MTRADPLSIVHSVLRSLLRIATTVVVVLAVGWGGTLVYLRQPTRAAARDRRLRADAARLRAHVEVLARDFAPRDGAHPGNLARANRYVAEQFERAGLAAELEAFDVAGGRAANVVAQLAARGGTRICRRPLVLGAHLDAFGEFGPNPGADDNASGVAGLLEIARLLAPLALPRCVELVAFANEEPPFFASRQMGSAVYLERRLARGVVPWGMVSLEMIGYFSARQPWPSALLAAFYPTRGDFLMLAGRIRDRPFLRALLPGLRGGAVPVVSYGGPFVDGLDASDHLSFWARGVPAAIYTDTAILRNPHYHGPGDTPESLDYGRMAGGIENLANAVLALP